MKIVHHCGRVTKWMRLVTPQLAFFDIFGSGWLATPRFSSLSGSLAVSKQTGFAPGPCGRGFLFVLAGWRGGRYT